MLVIDDDKLENDEEFTMLIRPKVGGMFKLSDEIAPKKVFIKDNEQNYYPNSPGLAYELIKITNINW